MDPFHANKQLRETCAKHGIAFMAYSSLGTQWEAQRRPNPVFSSPELAHVARRVSTKHRTASVADVVMAWVVQRHAIAIPRSRSPEHIKANAQLYDDETGRLRLVLNERDLEVVDGLDNSFQKAPANDEEVAATFENEGDEAVHLFWKPPGGGVPVKVGELAPKGGERVTISTYRGHSFVAKLARGGEAFQTLVVSRPGALTFLVRDPEAGPDL